MHALPRLTPPPRRRAPLSVYVLWHHECADGQTLASDVFAWFRTAAGEVMPQKVGLKVHYRSHVTEEAGRWRIDTPIRWDDAEHNWVVLLVDEHMIVDPAWREVVHGLVELSSQNGSEEHVRLFPVALHPSAGRVDAGLATRQFIVLDAPLSAASPEGRREQRQKVLRRTLTQAFAREARRIVRQASGETGAGGSHPLAGTGQLRVFLSHAKADGREIADQCRAAIYRYGQIEAFFDEHDLTWGGAWRRALEDGVRTESAALLAIETDAYASRPWCRRELELARQPRRLAEKSSDGNDVDSRIWRVLPTVLVTHAGSHWSKVLSELGNVPRIGWAPDRIELIIDKLMLEALLGDAHTLLARQLATRHPRAHVITWVPDVQSVLAVFHASGGQASTERTTIIYPGHGLTTQELEQVTNALSNVELLTYEEAAR